MRNCTQCDKTFKNSGSLATHRYRSHPYSRSLSKLSNKTFNKSENIETSRIMSETSWGYYEILSDQLFKIDIKVFDNTLGIDDNKRDIEMLSKTIRANIETPKSMGSTDNTTELLVIKDQNRNVSQRISAIENKLNDVIGNIQDKHSVVAEDLIDDMIEVKNLFMGYNYNEILSDIHKLQQSAKFVIRTLDLKDITDDGIQLLEKLSNSSKATTKKMLKDNFSRLVTIFTKLQPAFDDVYEDISNEPDETDSEDGSEHEFSRSNASGDENDSESDTDSEASAQSGESGSEREQSETVTESKDNDGESRDDAGTDKEYETYP